MKKLLSFIIIISFFNISFSQKLLDFENMELGIGFNSSDFSIIVPEIQGLNDKSVKKSLFIDFRFDFKTKYDFNFKPSIGFWSWGTFPEEKDEDSSKTIDNFSINFDFCKYIKLNRSIQLYSGAGLGLQYIVVYISVPERLYYLTRIYKINEVYFHPGLNLILGQKFSLISNFSIHSEIRREVSYKISQWKFTVGISMF